MGEFQLLPVAIDAFEFAKTGDDIRLQINRPISGRADETGGGGAHAFDRLGAK
jgi:hypothetical protein